MTENGRYGSSGRCWRDVEIKAKRPISPRVSRNYPSLCPSRSRSLARSLTSSRAVKGKTQTPYRDFYFRRRVAFPMRDFPDGSMRPRDFSAFSHREPAENGRVFTRQRRARTRDREKGRAQEKEDEKRGRKGARRIGRR